MSSTGPALSCVFTKGEFPANIYKLICVTKHSGFPASLENPALDPCPAQPAMSAHRSSACPDASLLLAALRLALAGRMSKIQTQTLGRVPKCRCALPLCKGGDRGQNDLECGEAVVTNLCPLLEQFWLGTGSGGEPERQLWAGGQSSQRGSAGFSEASSWPSGPFWAAGGTVVSPLKPATLLVTSQTAGSDGNSTCHTAAPLLPSPVGLQTRCTANGLGIWLHAHQ